MNQPIKSQLQINSLNCASPSQISIRPQLLDHHSLPRYPFDKEIIFQVFCGKLLLKSNGCGSPLKVVIFSLVGESEAKVNKPKTIAYMTE